MIRFFFLLFGFFLFVYLIFQLGPEQILSMLQRIGWDFFVVTLIYGSYQLVRAGALSKCLLGNERFSYWDIVWIRISGEAVQFLTFTGPFLAEPAKAWMLKMRGLKTEEAFAATLTEYLVYTFTSAAISIAGISYLLGHFELKKAVGTTALIVVSSMLAFLLVSAIAICFRLYLIGAIMKGIAQLPVVRGRFRPDQDRIRHTEDLLLIVLRERPGRFIAIIAIQMFAQTLLIFELYWILRTMDLTFPMSYPLLIEASGKFISLAFFFVPTQVGAAEGTYAVIFDSLGLLAAAGFTLSFVRRLRSMLVAGLGLIFMSLLRGWPAWK